MEKTASVCKVTNTTSDPVMDDVRTIWRKYKRQRERDIKENLNKWKETPCSQIGL